MSENDGSSKPQGEVSPSTEAALDPDFVRDVFVSYASQDVLVANAVVLALERSHITCWIAPRDVVPGALYADGIIRAITGSKVFVLVLSQNAIASNHVGKEVERASSKRRPIVALRTDAVPLTPALEYFLSESQWIDVDGARPERAVTQVVDGVRRHMAGEHAIDPRADSNIPHIPKSVGNGNRVGMQQAWRPSMAAVALVVVLVLAAAYFVVDRFGGFTHQIAAKPVAATVPAVQTALPAAPVISEKSVAVLPFVDMSEKKDQEYFSDGLSEELIDMLTKVSDLRVPARTSSFYFKGKSEDIPTIAKRLLVAHVLEGSVRKSGNHMRITVQLVRADNGYHVWSQTYDRNVNDIFKVQDEIAGAVVKALQASLLSGEMPKTIGRDSSEAYNLYLQAVSMYVRANTPTEKERVVEYLRTALKADAKFAPAWALLSKQLWNQGELKFVDPDKSRDEAWRAAQRALELDPQLADAHLAAAKILLWHDWDFNGTNTELHKALVLDPKNGLALSMAGWLAASGGLFDQAIELVKKSIESDPVNPVRYRDLGEILYYAGQYSNSLIAYRKVEDLNPSEYGLHLLVARVLIAKGEPVAALAESDRETDTNLREQCACRVLAYDALGRVADAESTLSVMMNNHAKEDAYDIGLIQANRGNVDKAFDWFERAYRQRDGDLLAVKVDPLVKNVQSDPRFKALLAKLNIPE